MNTYKFYKLLLSCLKGSDK